MRVAVGGGALLGAAVLAAGTGCGGGHRPKRLLYGDTAAEFLPVRGSVVSRVRVLTAAVLGGRFDLCVRQSAIGSFPSETVVVERIGVFSESLTFTDRQRRTLYACDGGVDSAGEHRLPWCGVSAGLLHEGHLLDPRLDVLCRTRDERPLAYAWVEPVAGAHWIGVDQGAYTEMYESVAGLPVRVATRRHIHGSRADFEISQYDLHGRKLVRGRLEAAVAG